MTIDTKIFLTQNISMLALQNLYRHYRIRPATQNRSCITESMPGVQNLICAHRMYSCITESKLALQNLRLRYRIDNCCTESDLRTQNLTALQNRTWHYRIL